jgi:hypothetical protein
MMASRFLERAIRLPGYVGAKVETRRQEPGVA